MSEGRYWKGIQPSYIEPEGEMKYNYFIPVKSILEENNGLTLDDLGIIFLKNINKNYHPVNNIQGAEHLWL